MRDSYDDFDFEDLFDEDGEFRAEAFEGGAPGAGEGEQPGPARRPAFDDPPGELPPLDEAFPPDIEPDLLPLADELPLAAAPEAAGEMAGPPAAANPADAAGRRANGAARPGDPKPVSRAAQPRNGRRSPHPPESGPDADGEFENPEEADLPDFDDPPGAVKAGARPQAGGRAPAAPGRGEIARQAARLVFQAGARAGGRDSLPAHSAPLTPGMERWLDPAASSAVALEKARLMQALAGLAARAGSADEAAQFAAAAAPAALDLAPGYALALWPALPALASGAAAAARLFYAQPRRGAWMQFLPAALTGAVARLARLAAKQRPPGLPPDGGQTAARVLAEEFVHLLSGLDRPERPGR